MCFACYQFVPLFIPECYDGSVKTRTLASNENLENSWLVSDVFISTSDEAVFMMANNNHVALYGVIDTGCNPNLITLDATDGEILHKGVRFMPSNLGIYHTAYNSNYFYLGYNGPGKAIEGSLVGAGGVLAYKVDTGEIDWTRTISGTRGVSSLVADDNSLSISSGGSDWYYLIDSETGEIISRQEKSDFGYNYLAQPRNFSYWYNSINPPSIQASQAVDIENFNFWAEQFYDVFQPPLISNNTLLVKRGSGSSSGKVVALNGRNGNVIWETEQNVVSNVAVDGSVAFFLTTSAELIAYDLETGQRVGFAQFSGGDIFLGENRGFFVAANGGRAFVYFGDSRHLFALNVLPEIQTQ